MASILTTPCCLLVLSRSLRLACTTSIIKKPFYHASSPLPSFISPNLKVFVKRRRFVTSSMASSPDNELPDKNPGLRNGPPDEATKQYFMQQTMFRIKDPEVSLKFYSEVLGMSLLKKLDFPDMKFSLYFMGYEDTSKAPADPTGRTVWTFEKKATIELTHNWGTEKDPNFTGYHNGNSEPRGFGHIGITVDDTDKACKRFESKGVPFVKKPEDGKMKGIAFIKDPDGYWIEIFDTTSITNVATYSAPKPE